MDKTDVITILIEHYKNNLNDAEIIFEDICTSDDRPIFHLSDREVQLNPDQKKEFIERYSSEIAPLIHDSKRIR